MEVRKQQYELIKYCFKITVYLNMQVVDLIIICSLGYELQLRLVNSFSIGQSFAYLINVYGTENIKMKVY